MDAKQKIGLDSATLAFVISGGGCNISTDLDSSFMMNDLKAFSASGGKLIISFGGANGPYLEETCTDEAKLFEAIDGVIQRSGIYNLDFDVEGSYIASPTLTARRNHVLLKLQAKYPQLYVSFTVPVAAPSPHDAGGLDSNGRILVKQVIAAGVKINMLNLMTMDYYASIAGKTPGQIAIAVTEEVATQLQGYYPGKTRGQIYSMIGMTPMIGTNDDNSVFAPSDAQEVTTYAARKGIGLLSFWALQRDQVGSGDLNLYSGNNAVNFQYYDIFRSVGSGLAGAPSGLSGNAAFTPNHVPNSSVINAQTMEK